MGHCSLKSIFSCVSNTLCSCNPKSRAADDVSPSSLPAENTGAPSPEDQAAQDAQAEQHREEEDAAINLDELLAHYQITHEEATEQLFAFLQSTLPALTKNRPDADEEKMNTVRPLFLERGCLFMRTLLSIIVTSPDADKSIAEMLQSSRRDEAATWMLFGLLCIACAVDKLLQTEPVQPKSLPLLEIICSFAKELLKQGDELPVDAQRDALSVMVKNSILCYDLICQNGSSVFLESKTMEQQIAECCGKAALVLSALHSTGNAETVQNLVSAFHFRPPLIEKILETETETVGLSSKMECLQKMLRMEKKEDAAVAVVLWGAEGIGKSTLAAACIHSLRQTIQQHDFKFANVILDNTRSDKQTHIKELQQQMVCQLEGRKSLDGELSSTRDGRDKLMNLFEKHPCLLLIQGLGHTQDFKQLLPTFNVYDYPKTLRIVLTCRESALKEQVLHPWKVKKYEVRRLSDEEAYTLLQVAVLGRVLTTRFTGETQKLKQVAKMCCGVPLLLSVISKYLRGMRHADTYNDLLARLRQEDLRHGFSYSKIINILSFIHTRIHRCLQDAFVDSCRFFHNWEWEQVVLALGDAEVNGLRDLGMLGWDRHGRLIVHDALRMIERRQPRRDFIMNAQQWLESLFNKEDLKNVTGIQLRQQQRSERNEETVSIDAADLDETHTSLRFLCLGRPTVVNGQCKTAFEKLKYLHLQNINTQGFLLEQIEMLKSLRYLVMEDLPNITHLCDSFCSLPSLKVWRLSSCPLLKSLPADFGNLTSLQELKLLSCPQLSALPCSFGGALVSLKQLHLVQCENLQDLPRDFSRLPMLEELILRDCRSMKHLPEKLAEISTLTTVKIKGCSAVTDVPAAFGSLKMLKALELAQCPFKNLPDDLGELTELQKLKIKSCTEMKALPRSLSDLDKLKLLTVENTPVGSLPEKFGNLKALQICRLQNTCLSALPGSVTEGAGMSALKRLDVSQNGIGVLPEDFDKLEGLEDLDLSQTAIQGLPSSFCRLKSLQRLNLSNCFHLQGLPEEFGKMTKLEELNMSWNISVKALPENFSGLCNLRSLTLRGCVLEERDLDEVLKLRKLRHLHIGGSKNLIARWNCFNPQHFPHLRTSVLDPSACHPV